MQDEESSWEVILQSHLSDLCDKRLTLWMFFSALNAFTMQNWWYITALTWSNCPIILWFLSISYIVLALLTISIPSGHWLDQSTGDITFDSGRGRSSWSSEMLPAARVFRLLSICDITRSFWNRRQMNEDSNDNNSDADEVTAEY